MKMCDYIAEVERQLHNSYYFEKLDSNLSEEVKSKIVTVLKNSVKKLHIYQIYLMYFCLK